MIGDGRIRRMTTALKAIHTHAWDFWLAKVSVLVIIGLQLLMATISR